MKSCVLKYFIGIVRYYFTSSRSIFSAFSLTTMVVTPVDFSTANNVYVEKSAFTLGQPSVADMACGPCSMRSHLGCADWVARALELD